MMRKNKEEFNDSLMMVGSPINSLGNNNNRQQQLLFQQQQKQSSKYKQQQGNFFPSSPKK